MKKLKHIALLLVLTLMTSISFGQTMEGFQKSFDEFVEHTKKQNFEAVIDATNPRVFKLASKEMLTEAMKQAFNAPDVEFSFGEHEILSKSELLNIDGQHFVFANYTMEMVMTMKDENADQENIEMLAEILKASFGEGNVKIDNEKKAINIKANKPLIGEYVNDKWVFMNYEKAQQSFMEMIFEKELLNKIISAETK